LKPFILCVGFLSLSQAAYGQVYKPDFNCAVDHSKDSIATMLCDNSETAKHELIFDQTYYALRHSVGKTGWKSLRDEAISDQEIFRQCIHAATDPEAQFAPPADPGCYITQIDAITEKYKKRLLGPALEEANRPISEHIALQNQLIMMGYMPSSAHADGVYGEGTRNAIETWQRVARRPDLSGFLSDADARILMQTGPVVEAHDRGGDVATPVEPATVPQGTMQTNQFPSTQEPAAPASPPLSVNPSQAQAGADNPSSSPASNTETPLNAEDQQATKKNPEKEEETVIRIDDSPTVDIIKKATLQDIINSPQTSVVHDFMHQDDTFSERMETRLLNTGQRFLASHHMENIGYDLKSSFVESISANKNVRSITLVDVDTHGRQAICQVGREEPTNLVALEVKWVVPQNNMKIIDRVIFGVKNRSFLHPLTTGIRCVKAAIQYMYFGSLEKTPAPNDLIQISMGQAFSESDALVENMSKSIGPGLKAGLVIQNTDMSDDILWQAVSTLGEAESTTVTR
jgi:peptidoglycan hydrolase-like protein with peptidoglycan-binding domain